MAPWNARVQQLKTIQYNWKFQYSLKKSEAHQVDVESVFTWKVVWISRAKNHQTLENDTKTRLNLEKKNMKKLKKFNLKKQSSLIEFLTLFQKFKSLLL